MKNTAIALLLTAASAQDAAVSKVRTLSYTRPVRLNNEWTTQGSANLSWQTVIEGDQSVVALTINAEYSRDGLSAIADWNNERELRICLEFGPPSDFYEENTQKSTGRPGRYMFSGDISTSTFTRHRIQRFDRNNNGLRNYKEWCSKQFADYNWMRQPERDTDNQIPDWDPKTGWTHVESSMTKPEDGSTTSTGSATLKLKRPVTIAKEVWNKDYKGEMSWVLNASQWLYVSWGKFANKGDQDQNRVEGDYYTDNNGKPAFDNNWAKPQSFGILASTDKFATALKMSAAVASAGMLAMNM